MLFLTYWFVLFAALLYPLYWAIPYRRARLAILVLGCCVFHTYFAGPAGVLPIVLLATATYLAGLSRNRYACGAAILLSAGGLVYYKYTKFLIHSVVEAVLPSALPYLGSPGSIWLHPIAPLAITANDFSKDIPGSHCV